MVALVVGAVVVVEVAGNRTTSAEAATAGGALNPAAVDLEGKESAPAALADPAAAKLEIKDRALSDPGFLDLIAAKQAPEEPAEKELAVAAAAAGARSLQDLQRCR